MTDADRAEVRELIAQFFEKLAAPMAAGMGAAVRHKLDLVQKEIEALAATEAARLVLANIGPVERRVLSAVKEVHDAHQRHIDEHEQRLAALERKG